MNINILLIFKIHTPTFLPKKFVKPAPFPFAMQCFHPGKLLVSVGRWAGRQSNAFLNFLNFQVGIALTLKTIEHSM